MDTAPLIVDLETAAIHDVEQYLVEPISAPANYKDPEKIAAYIAEKRAEQISRCALDPDLARIIALGYAYADTERIEVVTAQNDEQERWLLASFWKVVQVHHGCRTLITFNGFRFDLPVLMRRSLYLGVPCPSLSIDKYRSQHKDLMSILTWNGAISAHSLRFYCARLGIQIDDVLTGKDIAQCVQDGDWEGIVAHCRADVHATKQLAARLGVLQAAQAVA